jgi:hypothetical protein
MAQVGFKVVGGIDAMTPEGATGHNSFSLSQPAGWVMVWWLLSILLIASVFFAL